MYGHTALQLAIPTVIFKISYASETRTNSSIQIELEKMKEFIDTHAHSLTHSNTIEKLIHAYKFNENTFHQFNVRHVSRLQMDSFYFVISFVLSKKLKSEESQRNSLHIIIDGLFNKHTDASNVHFNSLQSSIMR